MRDEGASVAPWRPLALGAVLAIVFLILVSTACVSRTAAVADGSQGSPALSGASTGPSGMEYAGGDVPDGAFVEAREVKAPHADDTEKSMLGFSGYDGFLLPNMDRRQVLKNAASARVRLKTQPFDPRALKDLAYESLLQGKPDGAIVLLKLPKAQENEADFETLLILGVAHISRCDARHGLSLFARAAEVNPRSPLPELNMGIYYLAQGGAGEALGHFDRAVGIAPDNAFVRVEAATANYMLRNYKASENHLVQALRISPRFGVARYNLGLVYLVGFQQYGKARKQFETILDDTKHELHLRKQAQGALMAVIREEENRVGIERIGTL